MPVKGGKIDKEDPRLAMITFDLDNELLDEQMLTTYWVTYGSHLRYDAVRFYEKNSPEVTYLASYIAELNGRTEMIELYMEMTNGGYLVENLYLQELEMIYKAGFIKEYIYTYIKTRDRAIPDNLNLDRFKAWYKRTIPDHKVRTRVRIVYNPAG